MARRARRPARVPLSTRRRRGVRPPPARRAATRDRRAWSGPFRRRLLRGGRLPRRPVSAHPRSPRARFGLLPRLHADELAPSGGAELAAELGASVGRPPRDAVDRRDRRDGGARRGGRPGRRHAPARHDVVPHDEDHHAPARTFIQARRPGGPRHRLQSGDVADPQPAAGDDVRVHRPEADAGRGARGGDDQRRAGRSALADEVGSIEAGQEADLVDLARPDGTADPVLARPRTSSERSSSAVGSSSSAP